eukprot:g1488.t1
MIEFKRGPNRGKQYAMKQMWQDRIFSFFFNADMLFNELDALRDLKHEFLAKIHFAFHDSVRCYIILDLALGGDLNYRLSLQTSPKNAFNEATSQFYVSQVVLVLEYMHRKGYIHRDIKPENILLRSDGYILVTDLGISKNVLDYDGRCSSRSGTCGFMAPEVHAGNHGKAADYFALGAMLYLFIAAEMPFSLKGGVKEGFVNLKSLTSVASEACTDLILRLLAADEEKRIAYKEFIAHPWFSEFDWKALERREITPPLIPDSTRANCDTAFDDASDILMGSASPQHHLPDLTASQKTRLKSFQYAGHSRRLERPGSQISFSSSKQILPLKT